MRRAGEAEFIQTANVTNPDHRPLPKIDGGQAPVQPSVFDRAGPVTFIGGDAI
jgi:hypothetical protein